MTTKQLSFKDIFTSLIFIRIYIILLIFMNIFIIQTITPEFLKRKFKLLKRTRSQEFILLVLMYILYSIYTSIYENGIMYQTNETTISLLKYMVMKQSKKKGQKIYLQMEPRIQIIDIPYISFPAQHQYVQLMLEFFLFYTYILILKHKPVSVKQQLENLMKEKLKVDPKELSVEEYEEYSTQLQTELQKINYPITSKLRQEYMRLVEFHCDDCDMTTIFCDHSYITDHCLYHNDHYCPWTGQDIYLNNTANFYVFIWMLFMQSSFALYRHYFYFTQLQRLISQSTGVENFNLGLMNCMTLLLFNGNNTIQQLIFQLIINGIVIIPAFVQIVAFTRRLFYVFPTSDRDQLQIQLKKCQLNKFRLIYNENYQVTELVKKNNDEVYHVKQVKSPAFLYYQNTQGISPNVRLLTQFTPGKVTESFTAKESSIIISKIRGKSSIEMMKEFFRYLAVW